MKVCQNTFFNNNQIIYKVSMQEESSSKLSQKSRSILFHLKNSLKQNGLLLDTHVCNLFQYRKQKLNRKQFQKLIGKYDRNLILKDIDEVFRQLDKEGKNYIRYKLLQKTLQQISEEDDPFQELDRKSKSIVLNQSELNEVFALIELKDALIVNDEYLQVVQLFITQKDGYLTKVNVRELLDNLQFQDAKKVEFIIAALFQGNDRIQLKQFLKKLDLGNDGTRIRLSDYSIQESIILNPSKIHDSIINNDANTKSQFIKKQEQQNQRLSHEYNIEYSKILQTLNQLQLQESQQPIHSGVYNIEKIPKVLQPYFNYGSELQPPFAQLASNFIQSNLIFIDEEGPTYGKAKKWVHIAEYNPNYFIFQVAESIVMRNSRKGLGMLLQPKDITQGKYGNCYFLSAIAAIIQHYPELVYRLFVLEKNPSHIYGVRLFIDGMWKTIAVDGCFPLNQSGKFCGSQPHHNQIWVMLIEKAWAKVFKTYQNIHSGYNQQGLVAISGAPTIILLIKEENFLLKVQQEFKKGSIITCTTAKHVSQISIVEQQKLGVFAGHAYPILNIYDNIEVKQNEKERKITLLKMKNPWGTKGWKGHWSFHSKRWTQELRMKLNYHIDSKDGTFFICLEDFVKYFDHINISKVNLGYRNCHIVNTANRYDFYYNPLVIGSAGHYFFTIYQDNGRKYKGSSGVYQKSPSWLFLAKIDKVSSQGQASFAAVAFNASAYQHSTIEADLTPGEYLIISKVNWNYWEQHSYVLSSYGPGKVIFEPAQIAELPILLQFIRARSQRYTRQKKTAISYYKDTKIWKCFYFQHTEGLGFITISNQQSKIFQSTLTLNPCKGLQILPPFTNPIVVTVKPKEMVTVGLIIDPKGYSYKLMEGYKIYSMK